MINRTLIKETVDKYIAQRKMAAAVGAKNKELVDFCVDFIKSYYTQELFDFYKEDKAKGGSGPRVTNDQGDLTFGYWDLDTKSSGITDVVVKDMSGARRYFPSALSLKLSAFGLPEFFDGPYSELPKEFLIPFKEKVTALAIQINNCMEEINALNDTLMDPGMTITSIKKEYPELYQLIKS